MYILYFNKIVGMDYCVDKDKQCENVYFSRTLVHTVQIMSHFYNYNEKT